MDGVLRLFYVGPGGHLFQSYYTDQWHSQDLGVPYGSAFRGTPGAVVTGDRLDVFATDPSGHVHVRGIDVGKRDRRPHELRCVNLDGSENTGDQNPLEVPLRRLKAVECGIAARSPRSGHQDDIAVVASEAEATAAIALLTFCLVLMLRSLEEVFNPRLQEG